MSQQNIPHTDAAQHPSKITKSTPSDAKSGRFRGLIQRQLDELEQNDFRNWIERTSKLKFQRLEAPTDGNL